MALPRMQIVKPTSSSERKTRTVVDTILVTPDIARAWLSPPFQRSVRENDKVQALAEELKSNGGVWPGIVSLGILDGKTYIVDGQHRRAAFLISGIAEGYTDVRIHYCDSIGQMGDEFVKLNSQLVKLRPDDILRGLEDSIPLLAEIRSNCKFVGYDMIRRNENAPMVSMSSLLRFWRASSRECPSTSSGMSTHDIASTLTDSEVYDLVGFMQLAQTAFSRDPEYYRLWSGLNLVICMWIYRHVVLAQPHGNQRWDKITKEQFKRCLMSLSADSEYVDWLLGRQIGERDRSPAFQRVRHIFLARILADTGKRARFIAPAWSKGGGNTGLGTGA